MSIANTVRDPDIGEYEFPDLAAVAKFRALLPPAAGIPLQTLLAEQDALLARQHLPAQRDHGNRRQQGTTGAKPTVPVAPVATLPLPHPARQSSRHRRERIT